MTLPQLLDVLREWAVAALMTPVGMMLLFAVLGLLLIVGAVTSMRWCGRQLRRIGTRKRYRQWGSAPKIERPPAVMVTIPAKPSGEPLREGPGPRDWKPTAPTV